MLSNIRYILTILLVATIAISYHPMFFDINGEFVSGISALIALLLILIFITILPNIRSIFKCRALKIYFICLLCIFTWLCLLFGIGANTSMNEIRSLLISFICLCIGYVGNFSNTQINILTCVYAICVLIAGYFQITINIGALEIEDIYLVQAKNALGPMIACAILVGFYYMLKPGNLMIRLLMAGLVVVGVVEILTIRARLATLACFAVMAFMLLLYIRKQKSKIGALCILFIFVSVCIACLFNETISDYVINSFTQNREDDMLSGRGDAYEQALQVLDESPLWGNLFINRDIEWVHNYLLFKLSSFGIIGCIPWICLYLYLSYTIFILLRKIDLTNIQHFGLILILIPFIVSLGEPMAPYGPGTAVFVPFLLYGATLDKMNSGKYQMNV